MIKNFSAQNFDGELYIALDFNKSGATMYYAQNGDISLFKRFLQLLWSSTIEDGININLTLNSSDHRLTSTEENLYFDDKIIYIEDIEKVYNIKFLDYSKVFVLTYTQLLNLELSRVSPLKYLNQYVFHKPDSKSYYSPLEDIFYDIEQAKKYNTKFSNLSEELVENDTEDSEYELDNIKLKIRELENLKTTGVVSVDNDLDIQALEDSLNKQKTQDELLIQKDNLEKELKSLIDSLTQYEKSMLRISKIDIDVNKYKRFNDLNLVRVDNDLATFSYRIREREKILSDLGNRQVSYYDETTHLALLPLFVLLTVAISVGITLSVIQNLFLGLAIGFVLVVSIILFFVFNQEENPRDNTHITHDKIESISNEINALRLSKLRYIQNLGFNNEDDYYATKALARAITFQKENDLAKIHKEFGGKEISDYKFLIQDRKNKIFNLQIEIDKYGPIMSPEEYIKKRRDLDLLKLEKKQSLKPIDNIHIDEQLAELKSKISNIKNTNIETNPLNKFKEIIQEYYGKEIDVNSDFSLNNFSVNDYSQKVELLIIQRLAYIKSKYSNVELPFILEDPFVGVDNKDLIKKVLDYCVKKIQTVVVTEHEEYKELNLSSLN